MGRGRGGGEGEGEERVEGGGNRGRSYGGGISPLPYKLDGSILICFSAILFQSFSMISITIACSCLEHSFPSQEYTVI